PPSKLSALALHDALPIFMDPQGRVRYATEVAERRRAKEAAPKVEITRPEHGPGVTRSARVSVVETPPQPSDFERHVLRNTPIHQDRKSTRLNSSHVKISY